MDQNGSQVAMSAHFVSGFGPPEIISYMPQNPLTHKCLLELSWQISARVMLNANTCKHTDCRAELWLWTFFAIEPALRKIAPE